MSRLILLLIGIYIFNLDTTAQINRYVVFLTDKVSEDYPYAIDRPEEFLTSRALDRRSRQGLEVNTSDLPVNPKYVTAIKELGIDLYFTSRWMNAAIIQTDESNLEQIRTLNFVDSVALVAEGKRLSREKVALENIEEFKEPTVAANTDLQMVMLQADAMHEDNLTGEGMIIAVLDNGFRGVDKNEPFKHIWDSDRLVATRDFVENSGNVFRLGEHGSSVFSTIAGKYGEDFSGTAYGASFILCITEEGGSEDRIEEFNWLLGAEFADSLGADIINASLGYRLFDIKEHNYDYDDLDGQTTIVSQAAKMASDKGILVVVSAGNSGDNSTRQWRYVTPPADADNILTVGSANPDFTWTPFSSLGPTVDGRIKPDVAAMGLGTTIVTGNGRITRGNGTSFASPQIAGFAAGIWQANPDWTNLEVIEAIRNASHKSHDPDTLLGYGVPFYTYAVDGKVLNISDILNEKITVYPNPFTGNKLFLKIDDSISGSVSLSVQSSEGKEIFEDTLELNQATDIYEFEIKGIEEGLYFLSLQYDNQTKVVKLVNF